MASNAITTVRPLPETPTKADEKLARAAAGMVTAAKNGDERGVAMLLSGLADYQVARLFMILASAADQDAVLLATGTGTPYYLKRMMAQYSALRKQGVPIEDIPPEVLAAKRMYWRMWHRNRVAKTVKTA